MKSRAIFWPCVFLAVQCYWNAAFAQTRNAVGYVGWWVPDGWKSVQHLPFERLFIFDFPISESGNLTERNGWPDRWSELLGHARAMNIPIDLTITLMDIRRFHRVFGNPRHVEHLFADIVSLASDPRVSGIQLDIELYEESSASDLSTYRDFVRKLTSELQGMNPSRQLGVFLPFQNKYPIYDSESLKLADYVVVQGYDSHWLESKTAGPVAPLDGPYALTWRKATSLADKLNIPRSKQFMSYPLYGYEWRVRDGRTTHAATIGKGVTATFASPHVDATRPQSDSTPVNVGDRVKRYGASFDAVSASSNYRFRDADGFWHEGWFDDWWGMNVKLAFIQENQLAGLAFFLLGYDGGMLVEHFQRKATGRVGSTFNPE